MKQETGLKILVVDDDKNIARSLSLSLAQTAHKISIAHSVTEALSKLHESRFDFILSDFKMEGRTGLDLVTEVKKLYPDTIIVIMTAYASIENAVSVIKEGAYDYIAKPFTNQQFHHLLSKIQNLIELKKENQQLKGPLFKRDYFKGFTSEASKNLEEFVKKIASTEATVLLTGESGTGKSELAKLIHQLSPRASKPFVTVYCTTLTESLLESELYGHVKGAFTGATGDKVGQLEASDGGTLFLDEVGDLTLSGQAKLLRFLQEKVFVRVGGHKEITVDSRIVAATNKNLTEAVSAGTFREDLYFRLNSLEFRVPALRERREDLPVFIEKFLHDLERAAKRTEPIQLPKDVMDLLLRHSWPGNLRELRNTLERVVMLSGNRPIKKEDLPPSILQNAQSAKGGKADSNPYRSMEEVEKEHIESLLAKEDNLENVAKILGITPATLWRKRKQYGLS